MVSATAVLSVPVRTGRAVRPRVRGKFIWVGDEKFYVRAVTYGPFRPHPDGHVYPNPDVVDRDLEQIAGCGFNAIRTYDVPPGWLLDSAQRHGLRVMVGLQVELYASFLDDKRVSRETKERVRLKVGGCAGHPALLCYALANEITAPIVRWHGARRVERFLEELYRVAKSEDPEGLVCYVNYPSTEYLDLPFLDLACFNVYLESQPRFRAYLARLQILAGNRPLLMTEIGLDSRRNGEDRQAETLGWQVQETFAAGCAGAVVFAWTDDWHSRGHDVEDWDFGLTNRQRDPKPALAAVQRAFADAPFPRDMRSPRISVVVCTFNGRRTIRECLEGLKKMRYPDYEVIVVDDGSKDGTAAIARECGCRVISTENRGLSAARNTGLECATGEIVAYLDDDACPDPDWLDYLAAAFRTTEYAGVGGPNIPLPDDGPIASCIAKVPGGPTHVLLSDTEAEHIPGCNMAFRKTWLQAIGGFDPQFRVAGDDVDACWRIQERGGKLGFSPAAMVWHHTRSSVRAFWKQQQGYGKAEALLERKWPGKYTSAGHLTWAGRIYANGTVLGLGRRRGRIYQGTWGSAAYARLYSPSPSLLQSLPQMPEWYLISLGLAALSTLGDDWKPLRFALPLFGLSVGLPLALVAVTAPRAHRVPGRRRLSERVKLQTLIACLQLVQPLGRLLGRLRHGLTPWRRRHPPLMSFPIPRVFWLHSEEWRESTERLQSLESMLRAACAVVRRGSDFDRWDLEVRGGLFGAARMLMAEEYSAGKQLVRVRTWPKFSSLGVALAVMFAFLASDAALDRAWAAAPLLGAVSVALGAFLYRDCAGASASVNGSLMQLGFRD